jgi:FkbM family methyltransferase
MHDVPDQDTKLSSGNEFLKNMVCRDCLDIRVAFDAGSKKPEPSVSKQENPATNRQGDLDAAETHRLHQAFGLKALARRVARFGYRLLKPIMRPIAFRIRRYLIDGLRQEMQQEMHNLSAATAQEIDGLRHKTQAEIQKASAAMVREISGLRQVVRQEIRNASALTQESLQLQQDGLSPRLDRIEQCTAATARRVAINCNAGEVLVRTEVGFVLCAASDHALLSYLLENGELEPGTRLLIQQFLKPGDVYVDVGANIGIHTLAAARAMQGQGRIVAFEPFEPTKRMLEKTVWMNGFSEITEIHQAAVSSATGHQRLFIGATSGHHSLFALEASPNDAQEPVDVPLVRLDGVIAPGERIDLMKIDAEGAEFDVIAGSASLIAGNPNIALIVEFGPSHLRRIGRTPGEWFAQFKRLGLEYRAINQASGALEDWTLERLERAESINLFFTRANSSAWARLS